MARVCSLLILSVAALIPCTLRASSAAECVQSLPPTGGTVTGRLATVEPALRRITILPEGESATVELDLAPDATIVHLERADRELTLPALVIEVGSRVVIDYRLEGDRKIAARVTVEAFERAERARTRASDPTRQA
jgi:hypothetical protein